jgi:hypothetical protein
MNNKFDMNKEITPKTIESIKFRIPLYQRPYAWEEKQIKQLLDDLYIQFKKTKQENYYIGILSVAETQDKQFQFDLIDGQQRVTTLILIGKAALKYHDEWKFFTKGRLELYGRNAEQSILDSDDAGDTKSINKMQKTIEIAKKYFERLDIKDVKEFSKFIYEKAAFFISKIPSNYTILDKIKHFVRINNRGKQLENHEILKVQLISQIEDKNKSDVLKIWNDMLAHLTGMRVDEGENTLRKILDKPNEKPQSPNSSEMFYMPITTVPEFLLIALARYLKDKKKDEFDAKKFTFDTDKLIETFSKSMKKENEDILNFVKIIEKQVKILKSYFIYISRSGNKVQYTFWHKNDEKSEDVYLTNFDDKSEKYKKHLKAIQSFLHVSTEPHLWLVDAFDWCKEQCNFSTPNVIEFVKKLEDIDNGLIRSTRKLTPIENIEDMEYGKISHYWFYRLDYELWKSYHPIRAENSLWPKVSLENNEKNLIKNFCFRRCSSIEHINPQNPIEKDANENIHSFGNLALISGSRNSKFSNLPSEGKKQIIIDSEYTESLKMAHSLWSRNETVEQNGQKMHEILYKAVYGNNPK